jgi:putative CocE/NonD family hydrolase
MNSVTPTMRILGMSLRAFCACAVLMLGWPEPSTAAINVPGFETTEAMIPLRDGVKLHTLILSPRDRHEDLPILFLRTPYGVDRRASSFNDGPSKELVDDGYLFVLQDIRGKFKSEGVFVMNRPPRDRSNSKAVDEGTDAYDSIEWLMKHVPGHNGRVGMLGVSYDGWLTVMALLEPHPALRAASPQASPADMFLGDDFHHNGAFRLSYGFEYAAMMESAKGVESFKFDRRDTFEWYLALGALSSVNSRYLHEKLPTWNDFVHHPNYDSHWRNQAVPPHLSRPKVPTLNVAGWWDQEDFFGPVAIYQTWEKEDSARLNSLVIGPWNHGGWSTGVGDRLGPIKFGSPTAWQFREKLQVPFFAHHLKDRPLDLDQSLFPHASKGGKGKAPAVGFPEVVSFRTGADVWKVYDRWPPAGSSTRPLYLRAGGRLSFEPATSAQAAAPDKPDEASDQYVSDPAHPVPYYPRPISPHYADRRWAEWLVQDQRFVHLRPDVLSYETEPLACDLDVTGPVVARLFASTSGTDCDWIVKLIDVYPEGQSEPLAGYQLMVAGDILRARFRNSFVKPEPLVPGRAEEFRVDLRWIDHRFKKAHKIMVQIQSTWFPLIDRNPQSFVPSIFEAKAEDYMASTQRIYRTAARSSRIELSAPPDESGR